MASSSSHLSINDKFKDYLEGIALDLFCTGTLKCSNKDRGVYLKINDESVRVFFNIFTSLTEQLLNRKIYAELPPCLSETSISATKEIGAHIKVYTPKEFQSLSEHEKAKLENSHDQEFTLMLNSIKSKATEVDEEHWFIKFNPILYYKSTECGLLVNLKHIKYCWLKFAVEKFGPSAPPTPLALKNELKEIKNDFRHIITKGTISRTLFPKEFYYLSINKFALLTLQEMLKPLLAVAHPSLNFELPPYFPESRKPFPQCIGAHISIITSYEYNKLPVEAQSEIYEIIQPELNQTIPIELVSIKIVEPTNWAPIEKVCIATFKAPELRKMRETVGLTPFPNNHRFHTTVAVVYK